MLVREHTYIHTYIHTSNCMHTSAETNFLAGLEPEVLETPRRHLAILSVATPSLPEIVEHSSEG